jgi:hypothetical protein
MAMNYEQSQGGNGASKGTVGDRVGQLSGQAQTLISDAQTAVKDVGEFLDIKGRVDRHPYGMVALAAGIGYVLGGGLFTPMTARAVRLGAKLAALPFVKTELMSIAESAVDKFIQGAEVASGTVTSATTEKKNA